MEIEKNIEASKADFVIEKTKNKKITEASDSLKLVKLFWLTLRIEKNFCWKFLLTQLYTSS